MVDKLKAEDRSRLMARVRQKDTKPEIFVRRILHRSGLRFRLQSKQLPGSPDIVMKRWKKAIFVNGCFWHGHDCHLFKLPATRTDWWKNKVADNRSRDLRATHDLIASNWRVITVWQCAITGKDRLVDSEFTSTLLEAVKSSVAHIEIRGVIRSKNPPRATAPNEVN